MFERDTKNPVPRRHNVRISGSNASRFIISLVLITLILVPVFPKQVWAAPPTASVVLTGGTSPTTASEANITGGSVSIAVTLNADPGVTWVSDIVSDSAKADLFYESMSPDSDAYQWGNVITALETSPLSYITLSTDKLTVNIQVPAVSYNIRADQTVTVNIPRSLLTDSSQPVTVNPTFTVIADRQALIPRSLNEAQITQADIIGGGGKTIQISLINDTWASDIVNNTAKREALFNGLVGSDPVNWGKVVTALKTTSDPTTVINLSGDSRTVTITLPKVPTFAISADLSVELDVSNPNVASLFSTALQDFTNPSFFITSAATTVTLGGPVASGVKEKDIVTGGKTLDITLNGNLWDPNILANSTTGRTEWSTLVNTIQAQSNSGAWMPVQAALTNIGQGMATLSTDQKTLTLGFPAVSGYSITADQTIIVDLRSSGTTLFQSSYPAGNVFPFTISEDQAPNVSVSSGIGWENFIRNSGGTITLTLTNASWATDLSTNATKRNALIDGFNANTDSAAWNLIKAAIKASPSNVQVAGNSVTLSFAAVPNYDIVANQAIYLTVPKSTLNQGTADIVVSTATIPSFTIYLPSLVQKGTLDNALKSFSAYLATYRLDEMMVTVPKKYMYSVTITNSDLGGAAMTTVDLVTDAAVSSVTGTVGSTVRSSSIPTSVLPDGKKKFSLGYMGLNKDTDEIILSVLDGGNAALQSSETVKISTKSKALAPKSDVSGTYSLYTLTTNSTLLKNITSMYKLQDLQFATTH